MYTSKQCKLSIKRAAMSEQEKFSKQRPKYVANVEIKHKHHTTNVPGMVILQYGAAHEIKMLCVQQSFPTVNHCSDTFDCSCKWLCLSNYCRS